MIEDLFTEVVLGAVGRSASLDTSREDADWHLARLDARLLSADRRENDRQNTDVRRLYGHYLHEISVDDLELIQPVVHEWFVEQLSRVPELVSREGMVARNLTVLYFLFPETTLRHAVIGLLLQVDQGQDGGVPLTAQLYRDIGGSSDAEDNGEQVRRQFLEFADIVLDHVDLFPDAVERVLTASRPPRAVRGLLREHILEWSERFGGDVGRLLERAVDSWDAGRQE